LIGRTLQWIIGVDGLCGAVWTSLVRFLDYDKKLIIMFSVPYFCVLYWIVTAVFLVFDLYEVPDSWKKYRIQSDKKTTPDKIKLPIIL
jgi:hypothetical protein